LFKKQKTKNKKKPSFGLDGQNTAGVNKIEEATK
jgi:hypothetical protein